MSSRTTVADRLWLLCAACLVILGAASPLRAQLTDREREQLSEFEKYIRSKDESVRSSQVEHLAIVSGPESARLLVEYGLTDKSHRVRQRAAFALSRNRDPVAVELIRAEGLTSRDESVRAGAARALGRMLEDANMPALGALLATERSDNVRVAILQALALNRSREGIETALTLVGDRDIGLATTAIDMVAATEEPRWAEALHPLLSDKRWQLQSTALQALGKLRARASIPVVLEYFEGAGGRQLGEARACLVRITGRRFGLKPEMWRDWWSRVGADWKVPDVVEAEEKEDDKYGRGLPTYHQITTESKKILFVIDVSNSMGQSIRYAKQDGSAWITSDRMTLAREELVSVIETLDKNTSFNILAFESELEPFKPQLVRATPGSIQAAIKWVKELRPVDSGEYTKEGYQRGETNTFAALKWLYGLKGTGLNWTGSLKPQADTVFFLSDGDATCGELTLREDILEQVQRLNASTRVIIHTIAYDLIGEGRTLLLEIARETGGRFVEIGKSR